MMHRVAALAVCLSLSAFLSAQPMERYRVTRVIDGDTIVVETIGTVRLIGVDTPESVDRRKPVQFFAREASAFVQELLEGRTVRLEYDRTRMDRYARVLAYVYRDDGLFVNAEIVKQGYGFAYVKYPFRFLEAFRVLEREARQDARGLWGPR